MNRAFLHLLAIFFAVYPTLALGHTGYARFGRQYPQPRIQLLGEGQTQKDRGPWRLCRTTKRDNGEYWVIITARERREHRIPEGTVGIHVTYLLIVRSMVYGLDRDTDRTGDTSAQTRGWRRAAHGEGEGHTSGAR